MNVKPSDTSELEQRIRELEEKNLLLKESEERFRLITESVSDVIWVYNLTQNRLTYVSPSVYHLRGYTPVEAMEQGIYESFTKEGADEITQGLSKNINEFLAHPARKKIDYYELQQPCKNGDLVWVEVSTQYRHNKQGEIEAFGITRDITERLENERVITESELKFRAFSEHSLTGIFLIDDNELKYVNPKMCEIFGYSKEELTGTSPLMTVHPDDRDLVRENMHRRMEGEIDASKYKIRGLRKDGEIRNLVIYAEIIELEGKRMLFGNMVDITEQVTASEALVESQTTIESVINSTTEDNIWTVDPVDFKLLTYNTAFYNYVLKNSGVKVYKGMPVEEISPYSSLSEWKDIYRKVIREGYFHIEYDVAGGREIMDLSLFKIVRDNKIFGISAFGRNITKLKQYERELIASKITTEESEKQFRRLFENMEQGFALHEMIFDRNGNPADYRFVLVNSAFEKMTGFKADQLIGHTVKEMMPNTEQYWIDSYGKVAQTGIPLSFENFSQEIGRYFYVTAYSPKKDFFAVISADITKNKIYEKEIIAAKNKAEENDRLKSAFIHNVSHEIRTPLNAVLGFSELLRNNSYSDEKRSSIIQIILQSGSQLLDIIDDILAISRIEAGQEILNKEIFNINELCRHLYSLFQHKTTPKITWGFTMALNDHEANIMTDKAKLLQILSKLVNNSFKFTRQGFVEFGYRLDRDVIEFYVKDSGIGISSDMLEEIFKPFRQVEYSESRQYGGSGLGLSISRAYVALLGGKIRVTSEPGAGSTFYFTIPFTPEKTKETFISKAESDFKKIIPKNMTILIAEDEKSNYLLLNEILSILEPQILWAQNGREAVDLCKKNSGIKCILMDLKMPVMDGFEATRQIRAIYPKLPIIAQSAYSNKEDIDKAMESGCNDYIGKPISTNSLLSKIAVLTLDQ